MSPQANPRALVGCDPSSTSATTRRSSFNPRARVGSDDIQNAYQGFAKQFQSTRLRGARQGALETRVTVDEFQSTRPRGARLSPSWTNTNYSTKQSYIQVTTRLTKITRPAVPQFRCQETRANIPANRHHLPFARHRARQLAEPQGHKVSLHQNAQPFFANSSRGYTRAGYLLTHQ